MVWNKFDFVSGDEIIFEDNLVGEKLGEFPSQWDMMAGNIEVANLNGENVIALTRTAEITPLMKTPKNYLPEIFTIEFDYYKSNDINGTYFFNIKDERGGNVVRIENWGTTDRAFGNAFNTRFWSVGGEERNVRELVSLSEGWHRMSISFNQRALKIYINEQRIVNAPNVAQGAWFTINTQQNANETPKFLIKNVRIAKGAVPLYDRMMSDGKFITYGITFDVGRSIIKPESMGEINRIVALMTENPELKFSVEGHTDSTGSAASNQTLSEARSQAVVDKLAEFGIARDRLTAAGKGQTSPIADNGTDEGRAKNRRVEFVKM
jgi:outer membrane protein OmpA-like peptidoglycan-associated protein